MQQRRILYDIADSVFFQTFSLRILFSTQYTWCEYGYGSNMLKRMYKNVHNGLAGTHEITLHIVPFQPWKSVNLLTQHFLLCHLVCQIVIVYNLYAMCQVSGLKLS